MPYTFAHPLFALPLKRLSPKRLTATGLALGSMAPDFEYFALMETQKTIGHTYIGFLLMHLPICAALALVTHRLLIPTLPAWLPAAGGIDRFAAERASPRQIRSAADWLQFAVSLFIGFLTHLFMDGWTHGHTYVTNRFVWLHAQTPTGLVVYEALQFVLSGAGVALLLLTASIYWLRWARTPRAGDPSKMDHPLLEPVRKRRFRMTAFAVAAAVFTVKLMLGRADMSTLDLVAVAPLSAIAAGWMAAALVERVRFALTAAALGAAAAVYTGFELAVRKAYSSGYAVIQLPGIPYSWDSYTLLWLAALWMLACIGIAAAVCAGDPDKPRQHARDRRDYVGRSY